MGWHEAPDGGTTEQGSSSLHDQAAFIAAASVLVVSAACLEVPAAQAGKPQPALDAHFLFDTFVSTYRELCQAGFRPTLVLRIAQLLGAGARAKLPPEFVSDMAAVCISEGSAQGHFDSQRACWLERALLSIDDVSSLDVDTLVRVCQCDSAASVHSLALLEPLTPVAPLLRNSSLVFGSATAPARVLAHAQHQAHAGGVVCTRH